MCRLCDATIFNTMLLEPSSERLFVAGTQPNARRSVARSVRGGARPGGRSAIVGNSTPQFVLDLAVDSLELGGKIPHQHFQAPLAVIDDPPKLGALGVREVLVGKPDPGLNDIAAPRLGARVDEFDICVWH